MIFDPHILIPVAHAAEETANGGIAETLGVNWRLFVAQLINFAIILFVLWKWVFIPVAQRLTERTEKIEKSLTDAERIEKEKKEFEAWRNQEMSKAKIEASAIITAAQTEALKVKQQIAGQTKDEQQKIVAQAKQQIESEMNKALSEAKTEIADMVTTAAEKVIKKKLDSKMDKDLIRESLGSLQ